MKYIQYFKLLCKNKQYYLALHPGDSVLALVGLLLSWHWRIDRYTLVEQFGRDGTIVLSVIIVLSQLFWSVHTAKISLRPDKVVFYRILGFRNFDVFLLAAHTFFLSSITFSVFFAVAFNLFVFDMGVLVAICYFFGQLIIVSAVLLLLSKVKLKSSRSIRIFRSWDKLFCNKYPAIIIKEIFEIRRYPMLIFSHIIIALLISFLILIKSDYLIAIYIISAFSAGFCYDSYAADGSRFFLYKFLHVTKFQLFKYKMVASFTLTLIWVAIYTILYLTIIADSTILAIVIAPVVLFNACLQHFALGAVCVKKYPFQKFFGVFFIGMWFIAAVPPLSFVLYAYALSETLKLRKAANHA